MSTEITKDIVCPQCGESQKYRLYAGINAVLDSMTLQTMIDAYGAHGVCKCRRAG